MKSYSHACGGSDRTIVVGDIHGCYVEFQELCHLVSFGARDALVTVGDFLDRGPDSWKVAAFFRDLPNAFSVLGNHERRVAGTIRGTSKPAWSRNKLSPCCKRRTGIIGHASWNNCRLCLRRITSLSRTPGWTQLVRSWIRILTTRRRWAGTPFASNWIPTACLCGLQRSHQC